MFSKAPPKRISDADKLLAYAAWYYGKYAPPLAKLKERLFLKAATENLAEEVFERFSRYADDRSNLESKVASAATGGKQLFKTKRSLIMKGFDKDDVASVIGNEDAFLNWNVRSPAILRRLASFRSKGKSNASALGALRSEFPEFKDLLDGFVRENYPVDREILSSLHDLPASLPEDPKLRKKAHDRLLRAGFRFSDLAFFFREGEE